MAISEKTRMVLNNCKYYDEIVDYLNDHKGQIGIIYVLSRQEAGMKMMKMMKMMMMMMMMKMKNLQLKMPPLLLQKVKKKLKLQRFQFMQLQIHH